jgi:hypothetical protein
MFDGHRILKYCVVMVSIIVDGREVKAKTRSGLIESPVVESGETVFRSGLSEVSVILGNSMVNLTRFI